MKNITEYNHLIEKEMTKYKQDTRKIIDEFENKFNKGSIVATHHFNNASPELIGPSKVRAGRSGIQTRIDRQ